MFIFAHVFAGAILGLVFWHLMNDRRAIVAGIFGSMLPDLIDKTLGLLYPTVLGSGRTFFHALICIFILLIILHVVVPSRFRFLGVCIPFAVFLHQVFDEMWYLPANWFYPILGPFQGSMVPDYIGAYFWLEITNPSEWLFMSGTLLIFTASYPKRAGILLPPLTNRMKNGVYRGVILLSGCMGLYLVCAGLFSPAGSYITPSYNQVTNVMAGLLPLSIAFVMAGKEMTLSNP